MQYFSSALELTISIAKTEDVVCNGDDLVCTWKVAVVAGQDLQRNHSFTCFGSVISLKTLINKCMIV